MTSRRRLLAAMRRQAVDRIPVTLYELHRFGGCWAEEEPSYAELLDMQDQRGDAFVFAPSAAALLGDPNQIRTTGEQSARSGVMTHTVSTPRGPLVSVSRSDPGTVTSWTLKHYIECDEDIERFLSIPFAFVPPDLDAARRLEASAGEKGVLLFSIGDPLGIVAGLCDYAFFVTRIATDPVLVAELLDRAALFLSDTIDWIGERFSDACVRFWGPEYCGAPLMDPGRYFRPLVLQRIVPLVRRVHAGGNIAILHCHGRLDALLEMILETGADVLEPLEVLPASTADVTIADVRRRVGSRMCLAGGVQARDLDTGTPRLVRERVRAVVEEAGTEGLILLPTSAPLSVPLPTRIVENYRAMFDAAAAACQ
jgi:uroporphyrinogen-III decarboxylase